MIREIIQKEEGGHSVPVTPQDGPVQIPQPLRIYLDRLGEKRRGGVEKMYVGEAVMRRAERSIWRSTVNTSKPVFPQRTLIYDWYKSIKDKEGTLLGPGAYELDESAMEARCKCKFANFGSCRPRFSKEKEVLGAGTMYHINAWEKWEQACARCKNPGCFVPFESTPCNWRSKAVHTGSNLAPNLYSLKTFVDELDDRNKVRKVPQRRCYAEARDKICHGYFKTRPIQEGLGPGTYDPTESMKKRLFSRCNRTKGKFSKLNETPKDDIEELLGPGSYDPFAYIDARAPAKQAKAAFWRSADKPDPQPYTNSRLVAPGYFRPELCDPPVLGTGIPSVFKSKTLSRPPLHLMAIMNERLKAAPRSAFPPSKTNITKNPTGPCSVSQL